jgi:hypothetical protein
MSESQLGCRSNNFQRVVRCALLGKENFFFNIIERERVLYELGAEFETSVEN